MRCCRDLNKREKEGERLRALQNGLFFESCMILLLSLLEKGASGKLSNYGETTPGDWQQGQGQTVNRVLALVPQNSDSCSVSF